MSNKSPEDLWRQEFPRYFKDLKLMETRTLLLSEAVSATTAERVIKELFVLDALSDDPITIYINSPGGEVNSGFAIFDAIRFTAAPVRVVNIGLCASIASIINISVPKELRFATPNAKFLIHQPHIPGQVQGQASDIEITAKEILKDREKTNKLLAEQCGQKLEKVEEDTARDFWMSAVEALEYGLVSRIIETRKELN